MPHQALSLIEDESSQTQQGREGDTNKKMNRCTAQNDVLMGTYIKGRRHSTERKRREEDVDVRGGNFEPVSGNIDVGRVRGDGDDE